jgi:hypothetical protein
LCLNVQHTMAIMLFQDYWSVARDVYLSGDDGDVLLFRPHLAQPNRPVCFTQMIVYKHILHAGFVNLLAIIFTPCCASAVPFRPILSSQKTCQE